MLACYQALPPVIRLRESMGPFRPGSMRTPISPPAMAAPAFLGARFAGSIKVRPTVCAVWLSQQQAPSQQDVRGKVHVRLAGFGKELDGSTEALPSRLLMYPLCPLSFACVLSPSALEVSAFAKGRPAFSGPRHGRHQSARNSVTRGTRPCVRFRNLPQRGHFVRQAASGWPPKRPRSDPM